MNKLAASEIIKRVDISQNEDELPTSTIPNRLTPIACSW